MEPTTEADELGIEHARTSGRRHALRVVSFVLWGAVMVTQVGALLRDPSTLNIIVACAFVLLFLVVNVQLFLLQWLGHRSWRRTVNRIHNSSYLSALHELPNRNYLLSELRREMPRARSAGSPFVLLLVSLDTVDAVRERRGDDFADRSIGALVELLKRVTRNSDFIAHLDSARFCVMLNDCDIDQAWLFMRRVPGSVAVSDGHQMFDVPVAARMYQYDLEALYATDVLRDCEETAPLRRKEDVRFGSQAA